MYPSQLLSFYTAILWNGVIVWLYALSWLTISNPSSLHYNHLMLRRKNLFGL